MLNFKSLMRPQFWPTGRGVNKLKYILYDNACIVMSQIVVKIIMLLLKLFNPHHFNFYVKFEPLVGP